jgi:ATP-dependent helicase HepA
LNVFVRATNHHCANWGVGKLISVDDSIATVSWFDSPLSDPRHERIPATHLAPVILERQTRVYWLERSAGTWHVGRVRDADDMRVEVRFPNGRDLVLSLSDIEVRWDRPIDDPSAFLAAHLNESPQFAQARSRFTQSLIGQRGACSGMSALISSVIDLEPHQYEVVKRVLQDPIQRYVLADEVGLGKTIEAGVLIRQYVLDNPQDHRVSVIVPPALVVQWRRELRKRFLLGDLLDDSLHVLSISASPQQLLEKLRESGMVVIDEAHHLSRDPNSTRDSAMRSSLFRAYFCSPRPGPPQRTRFPRDASSPGPTTYSNYRTRPHFERRIEHRQALAESVAGLIPENLLQIEDFLDDLHQRFQTILCSMSMQNEVRQCCHRTARRVRSEIH